MGIEKDHLSRNNLTLLNSKSLVEELNNLSFDHSICLASFDISNLYTNIPLEETIQICLDKLMVENNTYNGFSRTEFETLLRYSCQDNYFFFNSQLYRQINGLSMGSSIAPILANIFLCHHEQGWLDNCPQEFAPIWYRRYVDDTLLVFRIKSHQRSRIETFS